MKVKGYADYTDVNEFLESYNLNHLKDHLNNIFESRSDEESKKSEEAPSKVQQADKLEVVYAKPTDKWTNIFKHIIIFTNDRDAESNKTLKNIYEAIENLKKSN